MAAHIASAHAPSLWLGARTFNDADALLHRMLDISKSMPCPHCGGRCVGEACSESGLMKSDDLSADKARRILQDGKVHGEKLTDRQARYFGWVAGGKKRQVQKSFVIRKSLVNK
jgi:hypothetical protein